MRTIQKTISLEPLTSRVPSVWPAYKGNKLYFFDNESLKEREYEYPTNYGMIPLSFSFSSETYNLGCSSSSHTMSFERLCDYYTFFKSYNHLLNEASLQGKKYKSAIEYYNSEINGKYSNLLVYGTNESTYIELDKKHEELGGDAFYKWINENVIPTYYISDDYKKYWKRDYLYYSDVVKWISWFEDRTHYEREDEANYVSGTDIDIAHWDCKNSGVCDCCDCEEYFNRGGERELNSMRSWYDSIQSAITSFKDVVLEGENVRSCFEPNVIEQVELSNSLENIGQYSALSPQYELGKDYRVTSGYTESGNTHSGTTMFDENGNTRILKDSEVGFCFTPFYMEKIFNDDAWDDYTTYYIDRNREEFVSSSYTYYAFDDYDRMYTGNTSGDVKSSMASGETYDVIPTDSILINGVLIPIEMSEYGVYDVTNNILGGRIYFVSREKDTSTPYTLINGKKIYADSYFSSSGMCYYFSFFKNTAYTETIDCHNDGNTFNINKYKIFGRNKNDEDIIKYIYYNDKTYLLDDEQHPSGVTIDDIYYYRISGYTDNSLYISDGKIYDEELNEMSSEYKLSDDGKTIYLNVYNDDITIFNAKEITGQTISKLSSLESTNKLSDDTGNNINGIYNDTCRKINGHKSISATTYAQPPIYTCLEPLYQVGNTSVIGRFKLTQDDITKMENNTNYFIGNIITDMEFYYKDVNGNKTSASAVCSSAVTSLSAITFVESEKTRIDGDESIDIIFDDNLYCDIEYYIGATLKRVSGNPFTLAEGHNYGVKYNETVKFVKTPTFYKLKMEADEKDVMPTQKYATENLPHKYVIYTYNMEQEMQDVESNVYEAIYQAPIANFTTEINLIDSGLTPNFSAYTDMDTYNSINVSPVFKEEYKMGIATNEKVDADIYIDRGINAAFEKHLKLGEVVTLEALTQLGNGYFKIMDS